MFIDRERRGPDPWLHLKTGLFVAGALLALAGVGLRREWLINAAIAVLVLGLLLRLLRARRNDPDQEPGSQP